jgi:V/A-type H+/Na+-transporting ATPase subunit E
MSEELQGLLDRINKEGIEKAEANKSEIISSANKEAEKIIRTAKKKADDIVKKSQAEAKKNEERAKATIQQAARDIIIELNTSLQTRMESCIKDLVTEAMTPELMGGIIQKMSEHYIKNSGKTVDLKVIFPQKSLNEIIDKLKKTFATSFKEKPEVFASHDFASGMQVGFKGSDVFFDFSDQALTEIICEYIGPRLATVLK